LVSVFYCHDRIILYIYCSIKILKSKITKYNKLSLVMYKSVKMCEYING